MDGRTGLWQRFYGAQPLHLLVLLVSFALAAYTVSVLGVASLWNADVWWQSIAVWFGAAIIAHDLVLFPMYAAADRAMAATQSALNGRTADRPPRVPPVNYIRVPALGSGLLLLLFFPGIIQQGEETYLAATGQTQQPFLGRWLLVTAILFAASAVFYVVRLVVTAKKSSLPRSRMGIGERHSAPPDSASRFSGPAES